MLTWPNKIGILIIFCANFDGTRKPQKTGQYSKSIDNTKLLKTNCSLMKVVSIAECNTFDLH